MDKLELKALGKINLGLDVLGRTVYLNCSYFSCRTGKVLCHRPDSRARKIMRIESSFSANPTITINTPSNLMSSIPNSSFRKVLKSYLFFPVTLTIIGRCLM